MSTVTTKLTVDEALAEVSGPVLRYLLRYVGERSLAEDLQQETLLRVARGLSGFDGRSALTTWALTIASRVAAEHFRQPERRRKIVALDEALAVPDPERAIGDRVVADEMNRCVREVIDSLPENYRSALILYELEQLSIEQTAEICQCSVGNAKIRIHRARARLREALNSQCAFYHDEAGVYRCDRST